MFESLLERRTRKAELRSGWISTAAAAHGAVLVVIFAASVLARIEAGTDPPPPIPPFIPDIPRIDVKLGDTPDALGVPHPGPSEKAELLLPKPPEEKPPAPPKDDVQPRDNDPVTVDVPDAEVPPAGPGEPSATGAAIDGAGGPDGDGTGTIPGRRGEPWGHRDGTDSTGPPRPRSPDEGDAATRYGVDPPVLLVRVEPVYPELERGGRVEGTVLLEALVAPNGRVESVRVLASPRAGLTAAAVSAVERWRYRPARQYGRAVGVTVRIEVHFVLR